MITCTLRLSAVLLAAALLAVASAAAPAKKPQPKKPAAKPATPKPAPAVKPAPKPVEAITPASLGATLKSLGFEPVAQAPYQRLQVEEDGYTYAIDLGFSKSGEWLVCMAHLASIPDLTALRAAPLLNLLATNDRLLGMSFSYERTNGRIMLNAALLARGLDPERLKRTIEELRQTVRDTDGLWNPEAW
ncbi:MAG: type III secretion system chaperone [Armatimonadota bacterium]